MKKIFIFMLVIFILGCFSGNCQSNQEKSLTLKLEVVRVFDKQLPSLTNADMQKVLREAERIIQAKLGKNINLEFHDNGIVSPKELFQDTSYRNSRLYKVLTSCKYDLEQGEKMPLLQEDRFKELALIFLKQYELSALREYFPGKEIQNYDDVFSNLMAVYHEKINWLKSLETETGEKILKIPPESYQSFVEWVAYMWEQDKYDIVLVNNLMVYDLLTSPYPHTVCKKALVSGSTFMSPKRMNLDGSSLLVNIFEGYADKGKTPKKLENKILGLIMAHEFGHTFYKLTDVYDHGESCLMHSSLHTLDLSERYNNIMKDLSPCPKCRAWITAKEYIIKAKLAEEKKDYAQAGELYLKGAKETLKQMDKLIDGERMFFDHKMYIKLILDKAKAAFEKSNNLSGIQECVSLWREISRK